MPLEHGGDLGKQVAPELLVAGHIAVDQGLGAGERLLPIGRAGEVGDESGLPAGVGAPAKLSVLLAVGLPVLARVDAVRRRLQRPRVGLAVTPLGRVGDLAERAPVLAGRLVADLVARIVVGPVDHRVEVFEQVGAR
ncbi:MAG: Uncharacterised protein [Cryomorphaceae bacterium]|nr:MAG: Uncharacterised protein [Cryomorphaceae bacterium]